MGALSSGAGLLIGAAGLGMQTYGSHQQAQAANQAAEWNAGILENRASNQDLLSRDALRRGKSAAAVRRLQSRQARAETRSGYASSGVNVNTGSAADVVADMAAWQEYDRQQIVANSEREAWGYASEADSLRQQAAMTKATKQNPWLAAGTTALTGGTQLWNTYSRY